jgi:hypothetical protein
MIPRVSVIIPSYNRKDLLMECLASLAHQTCREIEVVVVDDGSTDGTVDLVHQRYPRTRIVRLRSNRGFCRAINAGIRTAATEYILLLNNDMTLDPEFIAKLVEAADSGSAAMYAPLVLFRDDLTYVYSAGDRQLANGRPEAIGFRSLERSFRDPDRIFGVSGGAALYRREVFETVGLFDERFIAYFEDADLNFRSRLMGLRAEFVREAVAYHVGSASLEGRLWWRSRQCFRNHALLVLKDFPGPLLLRYAPFIVVERIHQARRVVSSARTQFGLVRALLVLVGALFSTLWALPHCLKERRRIQRTRTVAPADLRRILE